MVVRKGMWLVVGDRIGIANAVNDFSIEFHEVAEDGTTVNVELIPVAKGGYRQAILAEIPASRRPTPDVGQALGYV